jgi:hypothetical protein
MIDTLYPNYHWVRFVPLSDPRYLRLTRLEMEWSADRTQDIDRDRMHDCNRLQWQRCCGACHESAAREMRTVPMRTDRGVVTIGPCGRIGPGSPRPDRGGSRLVPASSSIGILAEGQVGCAFILDERICRIIRNQGFFLAIVRSWRVSAVHRPVLERSHRPDGDPLIPSDHATLLGRSRAVGLIRGMRIW